MEESDSDHDLEVTWESDTPDTAEGTDDAISDKPVASEGSSPSTVVSRSGSFGGEEFQTAAVAAVVAAAAVARVAAAATA